MRPIGALVSVILVTSFLSGSAYAHGTAIYVSTPVSAPRDFGWVVWVSALVLIVVHAILLNRFRKVSWFLAIPCSLVAIIVFGLAFSYFGYYAARTSTGPTPGLEQGHVVYWGFGWRAVGMLFCFWNLVGIGFLTACMAVTCRILNKFGVGEARKMWPLYAGSAGAYILCLGPYIFSGALTSGGWMGSYTAHACESRISDLGLALRKYADEHGGRLPKGTNLSEVMPQLRPYVWSGLRAGMPIHVCPGRGPYEAEPMTYVWNPRMSGKSLDELRSQKKAEKLLWCPYRHGYLKNTLYTYDILNLEAGEVKLKYRFLGPIIEEIRD